MSTESKIALVAITENGMNLAIDIRNLLGEGNIYLSERLKNENIINIETNVIEGRLSNFTKKLFNQYEVIIFIMATGIVVRSISEHIKSKFEDPAILVIDEKGKNVISLLSGHMGGANEMTRYISRLINANPVITTATDINDKNSLDMIAKKLNAHIDDFRNNVKEINYSLVNDKSIGICIDGDYEVDTRGFITIKNINIFHKIDKLDKIIYITNKKDTEFKSQKIIKVVPKDIIIGMGCRRNTSTDEIREAMEDFLNIYNIDIKSIAKIGSVDIKSDEKGIIELAKSLKVPFETVEISKIKEIEHKFDKSEFVKKSIGVYSVAEPVAYILSNENLIVNKHKYKGITFSMGRMRL